MTRQGFRAPGLSSPSPRGCTKGNAQCLELEGLDFSGSVSDRRPCIDSGSGEELEEIPATLSEKMKGREPRWPITCLTGS